MWYFWAFILIHSSTCAFQSFQQVKLFNRADPATFFNSINMTSGPWHVDLKFSLLRITYSHFWGFRNKACIKSASGNWWLRVTDFSNWQLRVPLISLLLIFNWWTHYCNLFNCCYFSNWQTSCSHSFHCCYFSNWRLKVATSFLFLLLSHCSLQRPHRDFNRSAPDQHTA